MLTRSDTAESVLEREGCPLHYWLSGPEGAPLLVFSHGLSVDHRTWDTQVAFFANQYRVLTWDARGHGQSTPSGARPTFPRMVDDLTAILDSVPEAGHGAWLVGQSMGGNISQEVYFRAPERVKGLVCLGCACNTLRLSARERMMVGPGLWMLSAYPDAMLKKQIAGRSAVSKDAQAYIHMVASEMSKADFVLTMKNLVTCLHYEPGYRIDCPLLLLRGQQDKLGNFRKAMPVWNERDPQSEYVVIPSAGHCGNMDQPETFNELVLAFVQKHSPVAAA